jgi:hypothetical protein
VINSLPSFRGLGKEDPYVHMRSFLEVFDFVNVQNVSIDLVCLRLFPFSINDRAKSWLLNNRRGSITSWEMLHSKFYHKFFPISKINDLQLQITNFKQNEGKRFTDSWEKFKGLTMKCPPIVTQIIN